MLNYYIYNGKEKLRCGYTTGSCAAMAAKAAAFNFFAAERMELSSLITPKGIEIQSSVIKSEKGDDFSSASVIKDAGDDIDATDKVEINAKIIFTKNKVIKIEGGQGVGKITKNGLGIPIGEPAINKVPREMILKEVTSVFKKFNYENGARIIISVPDGEEIAKKTFNPHLGIEGGISILGSSGIVEPKSLSALKDSIFIEMKVVKEAGNASLVLTPGNYGELFIEDCYKMLKDATVKCSNFIGDCLDQASVLKFENVLLVGHIGKFCKLSLGIMDTHSKIADGRKEAFCCYSALCGADKAVLEKIMASVTTSECLEILENAGLKENVMELMTKYAQSYLERRSSNDFNVGIIIFDNDNKIVGISPEGKKILNLFKEKK